MEEESILDPGLHDFDLSEIGNHFLSGFSGSKTRKQLIDGLKAFIAQLTNIGIPIEIWIDGSFTTKKENPNDIDLVLFSPASILNALPPDKQLLFKVLIDRPTIRNKFGCDVLFCPSEHSVLRSYWRGWYGFDRNEKPKGIARVKVGP